MKKIKCLIIEDDLAVRYILNSLLGELIDVEVVGEYNSVEEAKSKLDDLEPDILIIDVELPGQSGVDYLSELQERGIQFVIVTGHKEYAIKAFKLNVVDYLLKPIERNDLIQAIRKCKDRLSKNAELEKYRLLADSIEQDSRKSNRIGLTQQDAVVFVEINEIVRCEAASNYTVVVTKSNKKLVVTRTLKQFEDILGSYGFVRVHRSHLVNLDFVAKLNRLEGTQIEMIDGTLVDISPSHRVNFLNKYLKL
jgi:two-component system, LytTR family, response regulator